MVTLTLKQLRLKINYLNVLSGNPVELGEIGNIYIDKHQPGGVKRTLKICQSTSGGNTELTRARLNLSEAVEYISGMIDGIEMVQPKTQ